DTDDDGLWDGYNITGTDHVGELNLTTLPYKADTDDDELNDGEEYFTYLTDPKLWDTDNDTMPDGWEVKYNLVPTSPEDKDLYYDSDTLGNAQEYTLDTHPRDADTDNDTLSDSAEITAVRLRTNVSKGAVSSEGYGQTTDWIDVNLGVPYAGHHYVYGWEITNFTAEFEGSADSTQTIELKGFDDGGAILARWEPYSTQVTHVSQSSTTGTISIGGDTSIAQSFNVGGNEPVVSSVNLWLYRKDANVNGTLSLEIREDNIGKPSDTILCTASANVSNLGTTTGSSAIMTLAPVLLVPERPYWLVLSAPEAGEGNLTLETGAESSYAQGEARLRRGPSTWWNPIKGDLAFEVKGYTDVSYDKIFVWKPGSRRTGALSGTCIQYNYTGNNVVL
ncbi:MAG: hypothetical protein AB1665_09345, partial [Candidatus Thermoplasmatota archaeon]